MIDSTHAAGVQMAAWLLSVSNGTERAQYVSLMAMAMDMGAVGFGTLLLTLLVVCGIGWNPLANKKAGEEEVDDD